MHYTGPVYRHPLEADTLLLQVTQGCSHNKCTFCTMYKDVPFKVDDLEVVEADLKEARDVYKHLDRIFIENADPFVLSFERLKAIGQLIKRYFPEMKIISTYANISNIKSKTVEELKELAELGYNEIYIGIESGYDPALEMMNKGYTASDAYSELNKMNQAGMSFFLLLMLGVAGHGNGDINAVETVKLLNEVKPGMISVIPTGVFPDSQLEVMRDNGDFVEANELEMLREEQKILSLLEPFECYFYGHHANNLVSVSGWLHRDKDNLINAIEEGLLKYDEETLKNVVKRTGV